MRVLQTLTELNWKVLSNMHSNEGMSFILFEKNNCRLHYWENENTVEVYRNKECIFEGHIDDVEDFLIIERLLRV